MDYTVKKAVIVKASKPLVDGLLALNHNNRNLRRSHVTWLKAAIKTNQFLLTGQGIGVSREGVLIDGQHRLMAIREAGYPPVEILLVTGLNEKAKIYIDQHQRRSAADMLKLVLDRAISPKMAAVVKMHMQYRENVGGFAFNREAVSLELLVAEMEKHEKLIAEIMVAAGDKCRAGIYTALFHYAQHANKGDALDFANRIRLGTNLGAKAPAYKLREYILNRRVGWGRAERNSDYGYAVAACIADAKGKKIESFRPASSWDGVGTQKVKA